MICPFLEQADPRCASHLSLTRLSDAFTYCVGRYQSCPVYLYLSRNWVDETVVRETIAVPDVPGRLAG